MMQVLTVKTEGVEPSLLTAFHPTAKLSGVLAMLDISPSSYSGGLLGELDKFGISVTTIAKDLSISTSPE